MARGSDLLFNPPIIKKAGMPFLRYRQSVYYPWNSSSFFFTGDNFWIADDRRVYQKDFCSKTKAKQFEAKDVRFLSDIGAISFAGKNEPVFHNTANFAHPAREQSFPLDPDGLEGEPVHIFAVKNSFDNSLHGIIIYAIDEGGNLHLRTLDGKYPLWTKVNYDAKEAKVTSYICGADGTIFFRGSSMILTQPDNVFVEIRNDLGEKAESYLPHSESFVLYQNSFLFLRHDGRVRNQAEEIFDNLRNIEDISASGEDLAILQEDKTLLIYRNGSLRSKEKLNKPYKRVLLKDGHLLLFSSVNAAGDHLDEGDLFEIQ